MVKITYVPLRNNYRPNRALDEVCQKEHFSRGETTNEPIKITLDSNDMLIIIIS